MGLLILKKTEELRCFDDGSMGEDYVDEDFKTPTGDMMICGMIM